MRIIQLRDYLNTLIASGVDPDTPVCIHDESPVQEAMEVNNAALYVGDFKEDPSPKMCGFLFSSGPFLMLKSNLDYDPMLNDGRHVEMEGRPAPPEKSWPNGHWYTEPRRKPGQP